VHEERVVCQFLCPLSTGANSGATERITWYGRVATLSNLCACCSHDGTVRGGRTADQSRVVRRCAQSEVCPPDAISWTVGRTTGMTITRDGINDE